MCFEQRKLYTWHMYTLYTSDIIPTDSETYVVTRYRYQRTCLVRINIWLYISIHQHPYSPVVSTLYHFIRFSFNWLRYILLLRTLYNHTQYLYLHISRTSAVCKSFKEVRCSHLRRNRKMSLKHVVQGALQN